MRKQTKRNFRQQWEHYWNEDHKKYPKYEHHRWACFFRDYEKVEIVPGLWGWVTKGGKKEWLDRGCPSYPEYPKLKKKRYYPKEFNPYSKCPKAWNKMFHIRPCRRKWKKFCADASRLIEVDTYCSIWGFSGQEGEHWEWWDDCDEEMNFCECQWTELVYAAEGMPYPSHKMHIYYY